MSKIWLTSDTHFGHQRTLELSKRPYRSVEEMDKDMIKKWNQIIGKKDTVYHLGDFGNFDILNQLNGNVILLFGNYEVDYFKNKRNINIKQYLISKGFKDVYTENCLTITLNNKKYNIVHEPLNTVGDEFYLFGHIHKLQMVKKNGLNVGVDCHNFYPIDIGTIEFYRNAIENHYDNEVFGG